MMLYDGSPVIRNRSHILNKGYIKDTPAKLQFRPAWNWFYENKKLFERLNKLAGGPVGVYGEWLYALHGIEYDQLPVLFMPFDLYDPDAGYCLATTQARSLLIDAGFTPVPLLHSGPVESWEQLETLCSTPSPFSSKDRREGVYVKVSDDKMVTHRFKMVRQDFTQGCKWNETTLVKNKVSDE